MEKKLLPLTNANAHAILREMLLALGADDVPFTPLRNNGYYVFCQNRAFYSLLRDNDIDEIEYIEISSLDGSVLACIYFEDGSDPIIDTAEIMLRGFGTFESVQLYADMFRNLQTMVRAANAFILAHFHVPGRNAPIGLSSDLNAKLQCFA